MSLNILYLGSAHGTSQHRANALRRLGHRVHQVDPYIFLPRKGIAGKIIFKLIYGFGGGIFDGYVRTRLHSLVSEKAFDIVWVNSGELFGAKTLRALKPLTEKIINYNNDDPFGTRDGMRFRLYREAVPEYDLMVVLRNVNVAEARIAKARNILRVNFSADEACHAPITMNEQDLKQWGNDVVFVGTWMPERGPFCARLLELGVPLKIYGDRWQKAREWPALKNAWAGPNLVGTDYVKAIQCAKVSLGLLSKGNRDLHTTRTAEIPYIGGVLCAERTTEHRDLYRENEEAVFWESPGECAEKCLWLLRNPEMRERIAKAGRERCIANGMLNEVVTQKILDAALGAPDSTNGFNSQADSMRSVVRANPC